MFQGWRIRLREAEAACQQGRLEQASQLLDEHALEEFSPGQRLRMRIAEAWTKRAHEKLRAGEITPACRDMQQAEAMVGETDSLIQVKREATSLLTREVSRLMAEGNTQDALSRLDALDARRLSGDRLHTLREAARRLNSARQLCRHGRFGEAMDQLEAARSLRPDLGFIAEQEKATRQEWLQYQPLVESLHRHLTEGDWSTVVETADQLLQLAPEAHVALAAKEKGWEIVNGKPPVQRRAENLEATQPYQSTVGAPNSPENSADLGTRFLLWVDAVGGYLVCLDDRIEIGQATPSNEVHLPFIADISRRHARLRREGESYILEPMSLVKLNGEPCNTTALLTDNDVLEMGPVRMRFRQPHALSATARLDIESRHRTQPSVDSVLLFAESCVLGPGQNNHVVCRDWESDVVLFRRDEKLYCRAMSSLEIDGRLCESRAEIQLDSRICGEDFSMSLESL